MPDPRDVIRASDLTPGGSLSALQLEQVEEVLMARGLVLLPSDTCYGLAARPVAAETRGWINRILARPVHAPVSLAFHSNRAATGLVESNDPAKALLRRFCPGPITLVCPGKKHRGVPEEFFEKPQGLPEEFFREAIGALDSTIGARVPDSVIERDVADCTDLPVTTVAVRRPGRNGEFGPEIRDFDEAVDLVTRGTERVRAFPAWIAIEGKTAFRGQHSTVVRILRGYRRPELLREGAVPFGRIEETVEHFPPSAWANWS